jgi:dipeptidase E
MKLLLTSAGVTNNSIAQSLLDLLGKPTNESKIVVVPTAHHAEAGDKQWVYEEEFSKPIRLGWKAFGIVDLAAVTSLDKNLWWPQLEAPTCY